MKNSKRLLTLLLTLVMLVCAFAICASAEETEDLGDSIVLSFDTSSVSGMPSFFDYTVYEGMSYALPSYSGASFVWKAGGKSYQPGAVLSWSDLKGLNQGGSITFVATAKATVNPPSGNPVKPGNPTWPPIVEPDYPTTGKTYRLTVIAYVDNYYGCNVCNKGCSTGWTDNAYFDYSYLFESKTCNHGYTNELYSTNTSGYGYGKVDAFGDGYYTAGQTVRVSAKGATGYRFVGWWSESNVRFASKSSMSTTLTMPSRNTTVYAVFAPTGYNTNTCNSYHNHTIRYTDGVSNQVVFSDVVRTVRHGAATPTIKDPVRPGYRFVGWSPKVSKAATECVTYVAQWSTGVAPQFTTEHVAFMKGVGNNEFRPDNKMTRGEFAVLLYRLLDQKTVKAYYSSANAYTDVASDAWYNEAVSTLANAGVIGAGSTFRPTEYLTRAEMVTMLANFYTGSACSTQHSCSFKDVPTTYWAYDNIAMAEYLGWVNGCGANTFLPEATITRAEVAAMMNRVLNRDTCKTVDTVKFADNPTTAWFYQDVVEATTAH